MDSKKNLIENIEKYEISDETRGIKKFEDYFLISTDLVKSKNFHLIIVNGHRILIKIFFNSLWTLFIAGILLDLVLKKKERVSILLKKKKETQHLLKKIFKFIHRKGIPRLCD